MGRKWLKQIWMPYNHCLITQIFPEDFISKAPLIIVQA
uniref:Uncharacterized protein n=1 Tax=Rhizophora mucronata TaxID=61149 RepID=A0A2P2QF50_RHIMU